MFAYDLLLGANVILFVVVAVLYLRHPAASVFHPASIYLAFHGVVFVGRPILSRVYDYRFVYQLYEFQPTWGDRITVILAANLGFLAFMGAVMRVANQPMVFQQDTFDRIQRDMMIKPFMIVAAIIGPIALYSAFWRWDTAANDASTMVRAGTGVLINTDSNGYFYQVQTALASLTVMFAWLFRFRLWSFFPFLIFFILTAGTGGRGTFVFGSLMLVMLYLFDRRRRWPEWRSIVMGLLVVAAFAFVVEDRGRSIRTLFIEDVSEVGPGVKVLAPLEGMDLANMEYFEYLVWTIPQRTGTYDYFVANLQLFTEPVPRVWWPGKPAGAPIQLFNLFDYGNPIGMTSSLPGQGWMALGYVGVVLQCILFGLLYGYAYRILMERRQTNLLLLGYCVIAANTVVTFRDGALLTIARQSVFYLLPVLLTWAMMKAFGTPGAQRLRQYWIDRQRGREQQDPRSDIHLTPAQRRRKLAAAHGAR
jgi:oligosaccharide repeat unit polymerase